jgi:DNA-binding MarR family transcriptional regulator
MARLRTKKADADQRPPPPRAAAEASQRSIELVELLFFAYRDFTGEPDAILAELGFGRAHHRVLHFVARRPGLRVADLLDILRITKQSLARVLKQLIDDGFVEQRLGEVDRRERRLYPTAKGEAIAMRLARLQITRIDNALVAAGAGSEDVTRRFLTGMISPEEREKVHTIVAATEAGIAGNPAPASPGADRAHLVDGHEEHSGDS